MEKSKIAKVDMYIYVRDYNYLCETKKLIYLSSMSDIK